MIRARGLARSFTTRGRTVEAVKGVDIDVAEGELVGFLGPNGAGKTTTLRMLTTLLRPTAGEAAVGGCDLLADPLGVRRRIGYVAQGGGTTAELRVREELELQGRLYGLAKADALARGAELVERLDLAGLDQRPTKTLSGGQRRRLDIALSLIHDPKLLFFDEPTTGLDPQSRANLWDHIRRLRGEHGVTVGVGEGTVAAAAEVASRLPGAHEVTTVDSSVSFRVPRGDTVLPDLLRALDARGIAMTSVQVRRPTLDDVFLTLTGRSLRDAEQGAPAEQEAVHA